MAFSAYCQVWDVRFNLAGASSPCAPNAYDTITLVGANNDASLFTTFLAQGGHLLLMGDNYSYCSRNQNLVQFVNSVITSGSLGTPWWSFANNETFNVVDNTAPDFFQTDYASIVSVAGVWPGQILVGGASSQSGGGKVLLKQTGNPDAGNTYALALEWSAGQLAGGSGQLVTIWDSIPSKHP